jgi:preprotein translocase subunit YajC
MTNMSPFAAAICFLAQAPAPTPPTAAQTAMSFLPMVLMIVGFYFLFIAPQRKKQKAHEKMLSELQSGDEVLTTGGIYGVVTNVKEDRFIVRISDTTKVEIAKGFISSVTKRNGVEEKK